MDFACTLRIFLIGYRGTGKTTVGRLLADALGWAFVDADDVLEAAAGKTIAEIFADEGEAGFRDRESAVLAELCRAETPRHRHRRRRRPPAGEPRAADGVRASSSG